MIPPQSVSTWAPGAPPLPLPAGPLRPCHVCVVGAGIAGLSVALRLLEAGYSVLVLERDAIGCGETTRSSGHLASALDDRYVHLERLHGEAGARLAAESHRHAVSQIEQWCIEHHIDCGFRRLDGFLFPGEHADAVELEREFDACQRAGLEVQRVRQVEGLAGRGPALRFPRQARIDPHRYAQGLAQAVCRRGGTIARGEACGVEDGIPCRVHLHDQREVRCEAVVVCTNVPFHRVLAYHTKQAAYRTYVLTAQAPRDSVPDALYWDTAEPYHYVRWREDTNGDPLLLIGGADHKTGQGDAHEHPLQALESWARRFCSGLGPITSAWSGQIIEPADCLAYIGRDQGAEHVYVVTGDSGNGLTHATLAASLITSLVAGQSHPWESLYAPARHRLTREWLHENANVVRQYADWISPAEDVALDEIAPYEGCVVRVGIHRYAVSRDAEGGLHAFSARCPHLGGSVRWNPEEGSWDCPCHGSRFSAFDGSVLNGPALSALEPVPIETLGARVSTPMPPRPATDAPSAPRPARRLLPRGSS